MHRLVLAADLIVLGTHGRRGITRLVMGSDAEGVVRATRVPVRLVRHAGAARRHGARGTKSWCSQIARLPPAQTTECEQGFQRNA
jgi:hypothetical protein